jgi:hypothetical protein
MGGVCFFNLAVDTPNGDMALLEKVKTAALDTLALGIFNTACWLLTRVFLRTPPAAIR